MTPDIISAIDAATGCQQCGNPLGPSPSDDFCGEGCQQAWQAKRVGAPLDHWLGRLGIDFAMPMHTTQPEFREGDIMTMRAMDEPGVRYQYDGARARWIRIAEDESAHYEFREDGSLVDNTPAIRERQRSSNTVDEATAGADRMIEWAQHHLGAEFAPWQRSMVEQYYRHHP